MLSDTRSRGPESLTASPTSTVSGVRGPRRLIHFQRLAERAWIRRRLQNLSHRHSDYATLRDRSAELETLLSRSELRPTVDEERRFQRAALSKAIEIHGECSRKAQEHAARLSELEENRSAGSLLTETALQLTQISQSRGLMSYAPGYLYVFQRTVAGLQLTARPVNEVEAYALLEELAADETALGRVETTTRVDACRAEVLPSRDRVRIEVDHEGFWVSIEPRAGRRATLGIPFPRFEDARHYVSDTLSEDLVAGKEPAEGWLKPEDPCLTGADEVLPKVVGPRDRNKSLWSMLMAVPGYRSVFEEGVSDGKS